MMSVMIYLIEVLAHVSPHGNVQPHLSLTHVMKLLALYTRKNELGIIPVGIPRSLNNFGSLWLFVRNELIRISCNALASICSWPMMKINMLFEKIVRRGTSFQMVNDIFRIISKHNTIFIVSQGNAHPAMLFWQRGISYEKSSEVIPSPCEHVSSDEDSSSRITNCR